MYAAIALAGFARASRRRRGFVATQLLPEAGKRFRVRCVDESLLNRRPRQVDLVLGAVEFCQIEVRRPIVLLGSRGFLERRFRVAILMQADERLALSYKDFRAENEIRTGVLQDIIEVIDRALLHRASLLR